ncbi:MAG: DUF2079 domain-containing protein [Chitinophagaceae bacterium]|nr:DUF2079 domain-containing protein [Oligoflexus sp.]
MADDSKLQSSRSFSPGLAIIFAVFSVIYITLGYARSESGLVHAFDTGLYLQILKNLELGRGWASSVTNEPFFLAHHFQPILAAIVPWHLVIPSSFGLLVLDLLAILITCFAIIKFAPRMGIASSSSASIAALAFFFHPTIASRVYYSFVPEVLSLPLLVVAALLLAKKDRLLAKEKIVLFVSLFAACLTKEPIWLTCAFTCALFAIKFRKTVDAKVFAFASLLFGAAFVFIFFIWMPAHSTQTHYYALNYYKNDWVDGQWGMSGKILGAALNVLSINSLTTFVTVAVLIPMGLLVFGNIWATLGALPALGLILAASDGKVHALNNQHMIAALPFLAVSTAVGLDRAKERLHNPKLQFYLAVFVCLVPLSIASFTNTGLLFQAIFTQSHLELDLRAKTDAIKKVLKTDDVILTDGTLQPYFSEYPNVKVILGFEGNPTKITPEDLAQTTHVITTNDLESLKDCRSLKAGEGDVQVFDYQGFYQFCEWLKQSHTEKVTLIPDRLIDIKILRN